MPMRPEDTSKNNTMRKRKRLPPPIENLWCGTNDVSSDVLLTLSSLNGSELVFDFPQAVYHATIQVIGLEAFQHLLDQFFLFFLFSRFPGIPYWLELVYT